MGYSNLLPKCSKQNWAAEHEKTMKVRKLSSSWLSIGLINRCKAPHLISHRTKRAHSRAISKPSAASFVGPRAREWTSKRGSDQTYCLLPVSTQDHTPCSSIHSLCFMSDGCCMTCSWHISDQPHETGRSTSLHSHYIGSEPERVSKKSNQGQRQLAI